MALLRELASFLLRPHRRSTDAVPVRQAKRGVFRRERLVGIDHARLERSVHYKSQTLRLDLARVRNSWGMSTFHGRTFHETSHCHH